MKTRVITAVVAIACIFPFFWFSDPRAVTNPLNWVFPLLIAATSAVSAFELLRCVGQHKNLFVAIPLIAAAGIFPLLARLLREDRALLTQIGFLAALVLVLYCFGVIVFRFERNETGHIALAFAAVFYLSASYSAIIVLRDEGEIGRFLFLIPFIFAWVTDTFAYFAGRLFGRHKLIPLVSPKKTVEGAAGGLVFGAVTAVLYGFIVSRVDPRVIPNYWVLSIGGIAIALVSQVGDLLMSAIKRTYGVKDFGKMLPGHGGLLDRFDSSLAVTVLLLTIHTYLPVFTMA